MRINLENASNLEVRVCLSLLTANPLEITNIATSEGGLKAYQISLLEMFAKITNGAIYNINETGCRLRITPGTLIGGEFEHDCNNQAPLGYYVSYLILLSPFCQKPIEATLTGVTNKGNFISIERINYGLKDFVKDMVGLASVFDLNMKKRGAYPDGGGMAIFSARPAQSLAPLNRTKIGKVKKITGIAWTTRLNPTIGKRMIDGVKQNFQNFISDFYIRLDHRTKEQSGNSPGYGLSLVAITTEDASYTAEVSSVSQEEYNGVPSIPEELGTTAIKSLGEAIARGGIISSEFEPIVLILMALGRQNVSKIVLGFPGPETRQCFQDILTFTGVRFNIEPLKPGMDLYREHCGQELLVSCLGCGLVNLNRAIR